MWPLLAVLLTLTGCASHDFEEAYKPYEHRQPCQHCPVVPLAEVRPDRPVLPPTGTMLRTPSGDLYNRYGTMTVGPHGEIYTTY